MVSGRSSSLAFEFEKDLEDYLECQLPLLLAPLGQELMIIGRQVETGAQRSIDLLAIDARGDLYIIELKLHEAAPAAVAQVLNYQRSIKRLNREELIRVVANGRLRVELEGAFQRRFGFPLPETVNNSQVLMIIAAAFDPIAAGGIVAMNNGGGYSSRAFRYVVQSDAVSLVPCCRDDQDVDVERSHMRAKWPAATSSRVATLSGSASYRVHIGEELRQFWQTMDLQLAVPLVTFKTLYGLYREWLRLQAAEGNHPSVLQVWEFGRQLAAIAAESGQWTRVFIAPGSVVDIHEPLTGPVSARLSRDAEHWIVAYRRNPSATR